jgi:hypothetical protein
MKPEEVTAQLEAIASDELFESRSGLLVDQWESAGVRDENNEAVLRFMERHPDIDYGPPGPLVHFMERTYKEGGPTSERWDRLVVESMTRRPTAHTSWLLNRLINGSDSERRQRLIDVMAGAFDHPDADQATRDGIRGYLDFQASKRSSS